MVFFNLSYYPFTRYYVYSFILFILCHRMEDCRNLYITYGPISHWMVRSVETKRMRGTKEKIGPTGRFKDEFLVNIFLDSLKDLGRRWKASPCLKYTERSLDNWTTFCYPCQRWKYRWYRVCISRYTSWEISLGRTEVLEMFMSSPASSLTTFPWDNDFITGTRAEWDSLY